MFRFLKRLFRRPRPALKAGPPPIPPHEPQPPIHASECFVTRYATVPRKSTNPDAYRVVPVLNGLVPENAIRTYFVAQHFDLPMHLQAEGATREDAANALVEIVAHRLEWRRPPCRIGCPRCALQAESAYRELTDEYGTQLGSLASEHVGKETAAQLIEAGEIPNMTYEYTPLPPRMHPADVAAIIRGLTDEDE